MGAQLTHVERQVLRALVEATAPADQTVEALVERTGLGEPSVRTALVKLEAEGAVDSVTDLGLGAEFWIALDAAADRLDRSA